MWKTFKQTSQSVLPILLNNPKQTPTEFTILELGCWSNGVLEVGRKETNND